MTRPKPFSFDEFRATPAPAAPDGAGARKAMAEDLAAARAEGVIEGRRLAMETIAADEAAALQRIGDALAGCVSSVETELAGARKDLASLARIFLEEFCAEIAASREIELAGDLLRRLMENSEDRRSARLVVSARNFDRLQPRLEELLAQRGVSDFVSLDADHKLGAGEARLEWRGGEARRGRAEINEAVVALIDSISTQQTEAQS